MAERANHKPRMTLEDVCQDMREHGVSMDKGSLSKGLKRGIFPFGIIQNTGKSGRTTFLIWRRDYEKWAKEYLHTS